MIGQIHELKAFPNTDSEEKFKWVQEFGLSSTNGINKLHVGQSFGLDKPEENAQFTHELKLDYNLIYKQDFSYGISAALGVQGYNPKMRFEARHPLDYHIYVSYFDYLALSFKAAQYFSVFNKKRLVTGIGAGLNKFNFQYFGFGSSSTTYSYDIDMNWNDEWISFFELSLGLQRIYPRFGGLEYGLNYKRYGSLPMEGSFVIRNQRNYSRRTFELGKGSLNFYARLFVNNTYKQSRIQELKKDHSLSRHHAKKIFNEEKRKSSPGDQFYSLSSGLFIQMLRVPKGDPIFVNATNTSWSISAYYARLLEKNWMLESRFSIKEHWDFERTIERYRWGGASGGYYSYELSLGLVKKFILAPNSFNLLNLHGGVGLAFGSVEKGVGGYSAGGISGQSENAYYMKVNEIIKRRLYPVVYAGLSKDFSVTKNLLITPYYEYSSGILISLEKPYTHVDYQGNITSGTLNYRGSGHVIHLIFKYKLAR